MILSLVYATIDQMLAGLCPAVRAEVIVYWCLFDHVAALLAVATQACRTRAVYVLLLMDVCQACSMTALIGISYNAVACCR
jgi:hypothetical protein